MPEPDRGVCVCFALCSGQDAVLVMRRVKNGRTYSVLPGGGVEVGEQASEAAVRELYEETGLRGRVVRQLSTIEHPDRTAHYFLVDMTHTPRAGMTMSGPETGLESPSNRYTPIWLPMSELDDEPLVPPLAQSIVRHAHRERRRS